MLSDQILDAVGLIGLQKVATDVSIWKILITIFTLGFAGLAVDYARMLLLRAKMVCMQSFVLPPSLPPPPLFFPFPFNIRRAETTC